MRIQAIAVALLCAGLFVVLLYALNQVRKPSKWFGRIFLWIMNVSHSGVTDWGLKHVRIEEQFTILDVGCGGGRTVEKLAGVATGGKIFGVDYAKGSVAAARGRNSRLIEEGRVEIIRAAVSQLPFSDEKFDLVTAVETQYYWPDLVGDMREILRVLKPGGTLIVIAESYAKRAEKNSELSVKKRVRYTELGAEEERDLFTRAGYVDIQIFEEGGKGWICAVGKKAL